jgi:hypothetical protein
MRLDRAAADPQFPAMALFVNPRHAISTSRRVV